LEGVIVNITPSWIRAPLGKRPYVRCNAYVLRLVMNTQKFRPRYAIRINMLWPPFFSAACFSEIYEKKYSGLAYGGCIK
jgi:hypothetical protein